LNLSSLVPKAWKLPLSVYTMNHSRWFKKLRFVTCVAIVTKACLYSMFNQLDNFKSKFIDSRLFNTCWLKPYNYLQINYYYICKEAPVTECLKLFKFDEVKWTFWILSRFVQTVYDGDKSQDLCLAFNFKCTPGLKNIICRGQMKYLFSTKPLSLFTNLC
jgi:hypothetical protein